MKDNKKRTRPNNPVFTSKYDDDDDSSSSSKFNDMSEEKPRDVVNSRRKQRSDDVDTNKDTDDDDDNGSSEDENDDDQEDNYDDYDEGQYLESNDNEDNSIDSDNDADDDIDDSNLPIGERIQRLNERTSTSTIADMRKRRLLKKNGGKLKTDMKVTDGNDDNSNDHQPEEIIKKKKSKHAPTEVSSKRSDFYRNQKYNKYDMNENGVGITITGSKDSSKLKSVDPRTQNLIGNFNEDNYNKQYNFINDIRSKEIETIKKQLSAIKMTGQKGQRYRRSLNVSVHAHDELQTKLLQLQQEQATNDRTTLNRLVKKSVQTQLKSNVLQNGTSAMYFPKRSELKSMEYKTKLDLIRTKDGNTAVTKLVAKRRKKNKSRDASNFVRTSTSNSNGTSNGGATPTNTDGKKRQRKFY